MKGHENERFKSTDYRLLASTRHRALRPEHQARFGMAPNHPWRHHEPRELLALEKRPMFAGFSLCPTCEVLESWLKARLSDQRQLYATCPRRESTNVDTETPPNPCRLCVCQKPRHVVRGLITSQTRVQVGWSFHDETSYSCSKLLDWLTRGQERSPQDPASCESCSKGRQLSFRHQANCLGLPSSLILGNTFHRVPTIGTHLS